MTDDVDPAVFQHEQEDHRHQPHTYPDQKVGCADHDQNQKDDGVISPWEYRPAVNHPFDEEAQPHEEQQPAQNRFGEEGEQW